MGAELDAGRLVPACLLRVVHSRGSRLAAEHCRAGRQPHAREKSGSRSGRRAPHTWASGAARPPPPPQGDYESVGQPVQPSRFVPMKTPMSEEIISNWSLPAPPRNSLTVAQMLAGQAAQARRVGLIIDLANHSCLYDEDVPPGLAYAHIGLVAKVLPSRESIGEVVRTADAFWAEHPDLYVGIHCAYGEEGLWGGSGGSSALRARACQPQRPAGRRRATRGAALGAVRSAHPCDVHAEPRRIQPHRLCGVQLPVPGARAVCGRGAGRVCSGEAPRGQAREVCPGALQAVRRTQQPWYRRPARRAQRAAGRAGRRAAWRQHQQRV